MVARAGEAGASARAVPTALGGALLVLVLLLASCASAPWHRPASSPAPTAEVAEVADCRAPEVLDALGVPSQGRLTVAGATVRAPSAGTPPAEFVAAEVVECSLGDTLQDQAGVWTAVTERRLAGDLEPLLVQLRDRRQPSADPRGCTADAASAPVVWLVDGLDHAVLVDLPRDACARPTPAVLQALADLDEADRMLYPVRLLTPAEATD